MSSGVVVAVVAVVVVDVVDVAIEVCNTGLKQFLVVFLNM
jgi:hypothetical protein